LFGIFFTSGLAFFVHLDLATLMLSEQLWIWSWENEIWWFAKLNVEVDLMWFWT